MNTTQCASFITSHINLMRLLIEIILRSRNLKHLRLARRHGNKVVRHEQSWTQKKIQQILQPNNPTAMPQNRIRVAMTTGNPHNRIYEFYYYSTTIHNSQLFNKLQKTTTINKMQSLVELLSIINILRDLHVINIK